MTATTTTAGLPLIGAALLQHYDANGTHAGLNRADVVLSAGYVRPDGRPAYTAFYEAVLTARREQELTAVARITGPEHWHGEGRARRFALLIITTASGQQIGASLPVETPENRWSDRDTYADAEAFINNHAEHYANAAQSLEPDPFPLSVTIRDRNGNASLFTIDTSGAVEDDLADGISRCDRCNAIEDDDDGESIQVPDHSGDRFSPEHWCSDCADNHAQHCNDCSDHYPTEHIHTTGNSREVCSDCIENQYATCSDCGELYHHDHLNTVNDCDSVCRECLDSGSGTRYHYHAGEGWYTQPPEDDDDDEHQGPDGMRRYGYHTDANTTLRHTIPDTGHTYGVEMEYKGNPDDWPAVAAACHKRAILTNDSTVSGELVTAALSAGQIRRWLARTTAALTGTHNDPSTGFHIHTDARALTPWQWFTLAHYAKRHADTLETIAGRHSNQWSDLQKLPADTWPEFAKAWRNRCFPTRYAGINFSKGPTVEWRICRATKTPARALARFGMVQRMIALGRLAPSQRPQTAEELRGWLAQDQWIQQITGWQVGGFNYRAAHLAPKVESDLQPAPPSAEKVDEMRERLRLIREDVALTDQLRYNARRRYIYAPIEDAHYQNGARSLLCHYEQELNRLLARQREAERQHREMLALINL